MEYIYIRMEIYMMDILKKVKKKEKDYINIKIIMLTK